MVSVTCRLEDAQRTVYESREKIERQHQQLSDYEAEINLLRRRLETLETDREKDKKIIATLQEALNRTRLVSSVTSFPIPGLSKSLRCRPLSFTFDLDHWNAPKAVQPTRQRCDLCASPFALWKSDRYCYTGFYNYKNIVCRPLSLPYIYIHMHIYIYICIYI